MGVKSLFLGVVAALVKATPKQRSQWRLVGGGVGIHWEAVDEDISVESLLRLR